MGFSFMCHCFRLASNLEKSEDAELSLNNTFDHYLTACMDDYNVVPVVFEQFRKVPLLLFMLPSSQAFTLCHMWVKISVCSRIEIFEYLLEIQSNVHHQFI